MSLSVLKLSLFGNLVLPGYNYAMMNPIPPAIARIAPDGQLSPRQKRRLLLKMALQRVRPGTGSSHEFMLRRTAMISWPDLRHILKGVDWVIVGGVATRAYMPERGTKDLDLLVRQELVLMKLDASRPQDVADISRMLGWADEAALDRVRQIVARYSPEDMDDLESLIFLGQQERLLPQ